MEFFPISFTVALPNKSTTRFSVRNTAEEKDILATLKRVYGSLEVIERSVSEASLKVEMYVGMLDQSWHVTYTFIPADTPKDDIEKVSKETLLKEIEFNHPELKVAFVGLYHVSE